MASGWRTATQEQPAMSLDTSTPIPLSLIPSGRHTMRAATRFMAISPRLRTSMALDSSCVSRRESLQSCGTTRRDSMMSRLRYMMLHCSRLLSLTLPVAVSQDLTKAVDPATGRHPTFWDYGHHVIWQGGNLNKWKLPNIPGLDTFKGKLMVSEADMHMSSAF